MEKLYSKIYGIDGVMTPELLSRQSVSLLPLYNIQKG